MRGRGVPRGKRESPPTAGVVAWQVGLPDAMLADFKDCSGMWS